MEVLARTLNANINDPQERLDHMVSLFMGDKELMDKYVPKLVKEVCSRTLRNHWHNQRHTIRNGEASHPVPRERMDSIRKTCTALNLRIAARACVERFLNEPVMPGILMKDATKVILCRAADKHETQAETMQRTVRYYRAVASQLKDDEIVLKRFNDKALEALFNKSGGEPKLKAV